MRETLQAGLARLELALPPERVEALVRFGEAVLEQNKVMNLTAITEPRQAAELHLLDSLTLLKGLPLGGKFRVGWRMESSPFFSVTSWVIFFVSLQTTLHLPSFAGSRGILSVSASLGIRLVFPSPELGFVFAFVT